jgi:hypothetical protein
MPAGESSLAVGVNYPSWCITIALRFNGEMRDQHSFPAAALLGGNQDCFHEKLLSASQSLMKIAKLAIDSQVSGEGTAELSGIRI